MGKAEPLNNDTLGQYAMQASLILSIAHGFRLKRQESTFAG